MHQHHAVALNPSQPEISFKRFDTQCWQQTAQTKQQQHLAYAVILAGPASTTFTPEEPDCVCQAGSFR
jgi:ADP-heptose:LPS heptosyltransferase